VVSIRVSTVSQCDGAGWVVAAHRVVMVTLCVRLGGTRGFTLLLGTTPQAHLLLMSLNTIKGKFERFLPTLLTDGENASNDFSNTVNS